MKLLNPLLQALALTFGTWLCASVIQAEAKEQLAPKQMKSESKEQLVPRRMKAESGVVYTLYPQGKLDFDFVVSRPAQNQADIFLCIPSAFTTPDDRVDGVYISNGLIGNAKGVNKELGGAMIIERGTGRLLNTDKGSLITEKLLKNVQKTRGSIFQQFLIVHDSKAASFRDKSKFQRRAVCETAKGAFSIVESDRPVTFSMFNDDLVALGMKEALYCDMGAWDEGWYRSNPNSKVISIGQDRSRTDRQSNWLLLRAKKNEVPVSTGKKAPASDGKGRQLKPGG